MRSQVWQDLYHALMTVSWPQLFVRFALTFVAFNLLFALLYWARPECIAHRNPDGYWGDFFFSIETLATVGYGDMHPQTLYGHAVSATEIFIGTMSVALLTGVMFARFSRPRARFMFSRHAVIRRINGRTTLMLRAANARHNAVLEAAAHLRLVRDVVTPEGWRVRKLDDLKLVRDQHPIFQLGWTLMHVIDDGSPLMGSTPETLARERAALVLTLNGTDDTTGQTLMARQEYDHEALRWNHGFEDMLSVDEDGVDRVDYTKFHGIYALQPDADPPAGR
jgi:inward rectifier potassium channel